MHELLNGLTHSVNNNIEIYLFFKHLATICPNDQCGEDNSVADPRSVSHRIILNHYSTFVKNMTLFVENATFHPKQGTPAVIGYLYNLHNTHFTHTI